MTFMPKVQVEIAFGIQPSGGDYFTLNDPVRGQLDGEYELADVWTDVTEFVDPDSKLGGAPLRITRRRSGELQTFSAGTLSLTLRNEDRRFDPFNHESPYWPEVRPRKRIRVTAEAGGKRVPLFAGFIEDWPVHWQKPHFSHVTVTAFDALAMVAEAGLDQLTSEQFAGDFTGERIRRILERPEVEFPFVYDVADGQTRVSATDLGGTVLSHAQLMESSELGWLFCAADGTIVFRDRHHALLRSGPMPVFTDGKPGVLGQDIYADLYHDEYQSSGLLAPPGIRYEDITLIPAMELLFNRIVISHRDAPDRVAEHAASKREFLPKEHRREVATQSAEERLQMARELRRRYATLQQRMTGAVFELRAVEREDWRKLLDLDMTDHVQVVRVPSGGGDPINQRCQVEGVSHTIGPSTWQVAYDLSLVDPRPFLRLDDPEYGVVGAGRLAF